ncbi:testicular haploid expressed gene protein-like isoform X2 [Acanthaster planci]|uniref:Testicular haploid expressed gene protein-like isoform X2 n=1 Tax=Acanthaster planci TaxID=133434 RepID=A0A8B7YB28_ACAPL|nr:testicular haploid expressed gene protein-like isoform X2 [Acanthaster planci]
MATAVHARPLQSMPPSQRLEVLARPKQLPPGYREDRRSVYWIDKLPPMPGPEGTTAFVVNSWQDTLSKPKLVHPGWKGERPSPIWPVSKNAQKAEASDRLHILSNPKTTVSGFVPERPIMTKVSEAAKSAMASDRIEQLSRAKTYVPLKIRESYEFDCFMWDQEISKAARNARASERLEALAESKRHHPNFQDARSIQWDVSESALKAIATLRLQQLARPKSRSKYDNYDPYKVSPASLHTRATPRIEELCLPIPRKIRQKRVVGGGGGGGGAI